jgi:hypothetical protein
MWNSLWSMLFKICAYLLHLCWPHWFQYGTSNFIVYSHKSSPSIMDVATLASSLNWLGHFSVLARVTSANPSHSAILRVNSPKLWTPKFVGGGPTLLHLHSGLTSQSVTNGVRWTSIHGSPTLSWSSHCRSNTTTTQAILGNYAFTLGQCPWRPCRLASGAWGHTTSPTVNKPLVSLPRVGAK